MEVKSGDIHLRKGLLNKKSKKWLVVQSHSEDGPAVLKVFDNKDHYDKPDKQKYKTYSMENLKEQDIDKVVKSSSKEYYLDVPFKKEKVTLMFDSGEEVEEWYNALIQAMTTDLNQDGVRENILYQSQDLSSVPSFTVGVQESDASRRVGLHGSYNLIVTPSALLLEDKTSKEVKCNWAFEFIRRYGLEKKTGIFLIMAGRRCSTGEGKFELLISDADRFSLTNAIDSQVKKKVPPGSYVPLATKLQINKEKESDGRTNLSDKRMSEPLTIMVPSNNSTTNSKSHAESRESLKSVNPSQLTPEFRQELEEHIKNPPPSPDGKIEFKNNKERDKNKSKGGFNIFRKGDKKKSSERKSDGSKISSKTQSDARKNSVINRDDPVYDEADVKKMEKKAEERMYEEAETVRSNAWSKMGQSGEIHEEDYDKIKKAAKENEGKTFDVMQDSVEDDDLYDHVRLDTDPKLKIDNTQNIYGFSSGKPLNEIVDDENYATADFETENLEEDEYTFANTEDDPYDDTGIPEENPTEYMDALSLQNKKASNRPQLYEEVP